MWTNRNFTAASASYRKALEAINEGVANSEGTSLSSSSVGADDNESVVRALALSGLGSCDLAARKCADAIPSLSASSDILAKHFLDSLQAYVEKAENDEKNSSNQTEGT